MRRVDRPERDLLGEGPVWLPDRRRLLWVDIKAPALRWLDPATGDTGSHRFDEPIGWALPRAGREDLIVGLKSGFHIFDPSSGALELIGAPEPDRPHNRLNDAKVDRAGRIWAGSKDDRDLEASGALYRLDPDHRWSRQDDGYGVANGPAFSLDGRTLFHTDSARRTIFAFDLDSDGALSGRRAHIAFPDEWGYPDGMTGDAEGCLWVAHWGGARISRFSPGGELIRSIGLPATNVTSMTFAGDDLDRLYVTTSCEGMEREQDAGALFELDPGVRGLPSKAFAG